MLRLIRQVVLSISFLSVSCLAAAAGASTMTYQLSGTIDAIDVIGASPIGIEVGSTFSVTVTVEDTAADFQLSSTEGWFMALSDVSVSVGTAGSSITNANLDESSTFRQEVTPLRGQLVVRSDRLHARSLRRELIPGQLRCGDLDRSQHRGGT